MLEQIIHYDQEIFLFINQTISNLLFDWLMPFLRNPYTWAPLYLFLVIFLIRNYKKKGMVMLAFFIMTFGVTDHTSSKVIKHEVMRVRPCNDVDFKEHVNLRIRCGGGYSFPSSHAANHFAMGIFLLVIFRKRWKPIVWLTLGWAASISFAQVYVGVHYPIDILAGATLGSLIGFLIASIYLYFQPNKPIENA